MTSASFWTRPTSTTFWRTSIGAGTASSNRKAGALVVTTIRSSGARSRTTRSTSPVRVACPNPCPET